MRKRRASWMLVCALASLAACAAGGPPPPAPLDTASEACSWCRMTISDQHLAAQIVAPMEEPKFFDDIGCLRDYLATEGRAPEGSAVYVADHRTGSWVPGAAALYTRAEGLDTPMGSHLIAHADAASREADPLARGGLPSTPAEIFGSSGLPGGNP
jgi:copper chaperone NosL